MAALLLFSACDGGRPSKEEFIERADEICASMNSAARELEKPRSPEGFGEYIEAAREITNEGLEDLRELEPPPGDRPTIDRLLDELQRVADLLPDVQEAVAGQDLDRLETLGRQVARSARRAEEIAEEYGFEECGRTQVDPTT